MPPNPDAAAPPIHSHAPAPTLWPAAVSLAVAFMLWGLVSSLIITGIGLVLFVLGIAKWIMELRHERNT